MKAGCQPESHVTTLKNMLLEITREKLIDLMQNSNEIQPQVSIDLGEPIGVEDLNKLSDGIENLSILSTSDPSTGLPEFVQQFSGKQSVTALLEALCTPVPTEKDRMQYQISYA